MVADSLFPIHLGKDTDALWWAWPNLTPLVGHEARDVLENVVAFLLLQWVDGVTVHGGRVPDINDLLFNTVGIPIGYGLLRAALLLPVLR